MALPPSNVETQTIYPLTLRELLTGSPMKLVQAATTTQSRIKNQYLLSLSTTRGTSYTFPVLNEFPEHARPIELIQTIRT